MKNNKPDEKNKIVFVFYVSIVEATTSYTINIY